MKSIKFITIFSMLLLAVYADWDWDEYHDHSCETDDGCTRKDFFCKDGQCQHKDLHYILNWVIAIWLSCCICLIGGFIRSEFYDRKQKKVKRVKRVK